MAEYIEKEKASLILREEAAAHYPTPYHVGLLAAARAIDSIPAADVRPVVRARWIMNDECRTVCSLCGNVVAFVSHPDRRWDFGNFCPQLRG